MRCTERRRPRTSIMTGLIAMALASPVLLADEWPRFRELPAGVAVDDPALPDTWSTTENVVWKGHGREHCGAGTAATGPLPRRLAGLRGTS